MTSEQRRWVEAVLANDESSSDGELVRYFVDNGLSATVARKWVRKRGRYLREMFNPHTRSTGMTKLQRKVQSAKKAADRRVAVALAKYLKQQNPGRKFVAARVQKLKGGAIKITPMTDPRKKR
jgi:hypothetical protein